MGKKVLLVEDDFFMKELYQRTLEMQGFEVTTACDGQEAIQLYPQMQPDVVILDIMLPTVSGIDVLKSIRESADAAGKEVPVMMVTNLNTPDSVEEAMKLGANEYWVKSDKTPSDIADGVSHYLVG